MTSLGAAREALRRRQGQGARYDAPEAPAEILAQIRLGTAFFARKLAELQDGELYQPGRVSDLVRAKIVALISLQARAICWQIEVDDPDAEGASDPESSLYLTDIELSATLPPRALRHLFEHSAIHLDVVWRDLSGPAWDAPSRAVDGVLSRPMRLVAAERARSIWRAAFDLGNGARLRDLPPLFRSEGFATDAKEPT